MNNLFFALFLLLICLLMTWDFIVSENKSKTKWYAKVRPKHKKQKLILKRI